MTSILMYRDRTEITLEKQMALQKITLIHSEASCKIERSDDDMKCVILRVH